jgi:ribonucleotide monophosphatase NagD (HAD superfamily)
MGLKTLLKQDPSLLWKDILFVGDSMGTDIRTSIENGIDCALVMSGTTTPEKLHRSALQPNYVFPSIKEVHVALAAGQMSTREEDE